MILSPQGPSSGQSRGLEPKLTAQARGAMSSRRRRQQTARRADTGGEEGYDRAQPKCSGLGRRSLQERGARRSRLRVEDGRSQPPAGGDSALGPNIRPTRARRTHLTEKHLLVAPRPATGRRWQSVRFRQSGTSNDGTAADDDSIVAGGRTRAGNGTTAVSMHAIGNQQSQQSPGNEVREEAVLVLWALPYASVRCTYSRTRLCGPLTPVHEVPDPLC
jgi:hypothetical protein